MKLIQVKRLSIPNKKLRLLEKIERRAFQYKSELSKRFESKI